MPHDSRWTVFLTIPLALLIALLVLHISTPRVHIAAPPDGGSVRKAGRVDEGCLGGAEEESLSDAPALFTSEPQTRFPQ